MNHGQSKRFWEDFHKHPQARMMALDQLAVINKITIRRANETKMSKLVQSVLAANHRLEKEVRILRESNDDQVFIKHIASELPPGEEVICKICGKTAREIINGLLREVSKTMATGPTGPSNPMPVQVGPVGHERKEATHEVPIV
jgi:hypothetical protein